MDTTKMTMKIPKKDRLGVMSMDAGTGTITGEQAPWSKDYIFGYLIRTNPHLNLVIEVFLQ